MSYSQWIQGTAESIAAQYEKAPIALYGRAIRLPDRPMVIRLIREFQKLLFPVYFGDRTLLGLSSEQYSQLILEQIASRLQEQIALALDEDSDTEEKAKRLTAEFLQKIPEIQALLLTDLEATLAGDPAASNRQEILLSYPGFYAIFVYRIAHALYALQIPTLPRMMTEYAHNTTGVDIHPGAEIGAYFFIDHGTGVVVGQTTHIGNRVKIYQGVTLGALSPGSPHGEVNGKRHPTVEDNVTIYSGATILGGGTVIGANAIIGGNVFLTESVLPNSKVYLKTPELVIRPQREK